MLVRVHTHNQTWGEEVLHGAWEVRFYCSEYYCVCVETEANYKTPAWIEENEDCEKSCSKVLMRSTVYYYCKKAHDSYI